MLQSCSTCHQTSLKTDSSIVLMLGLFRCATQIGQDQFNPIRIYNIQGRIHQYLATFCQGKFWDLTKATSETCGWGHISADSVWWMIRQDPVPSWNDSDLIPTQKSLTHGLSLNGLNCCSDDAMPHQNVLWHVLILRTIQSQDVPGIISTFRRRVLVLWATRILDLGWIVGGEGCEELKMMLLFFLCVCVCSSRWILISRG